MKRPRVLGQYKQLSILKSLVLELFAISPIMRRKIMNMGELLAHGAFVKSHFGVENLERNRERVWEQIASILKKRVDTSIFVEFGVAWGYLTWWWFLNYQNLIKEWDGFDRFSGLPRDWRNLKAGTFDTKGRVPDLSDHRINWHVGDISETITKFEKLKTRKQERVILFFDLDLLEPSLIAWTFVRPYLKKGDIVYFDEAFDLDEKSLIQDHVLPSGRYSFVASSWTSLAIEVEEIFD